MSSKLSLFSTFTDISGDASFNSSTHRVMPYTSLKVSCINANPGNLIHVDQAVTPDDLDVATKRKRMTVELHDKADLYTFPVTHEYAKLRFIENTTTDTTGLEITAQGDTDKTHPYKLHRTVYDNAAVVGGSLSETYSVDHLRKFELFGEADASCTISPYVSADNISFYKHSDVAVLPASGTFHHSFETTSHSLKVHFDNSVTATLFLTGGE